MHNNEMSECQKKIHDYEKVSLKSNISKKTKKFFLLSSQKFYFRVCTCRGKPQAPAGITMEIPRKDTPLLSFLVLHLFCESRQRRDELLVV